MQGIESLLRFLAARKLLLREVHPDLLQTHPGAVLHVLAREGLVDEALALEAVAQHLKVPLFEPDSIDTVDVSRSSHLVEKLTGKKCVQFQMLPVEIQGGARRLLMTNPFDLEAKSFAEFALGKTCEIWVVSHAVLTRLLCRCDPQEAQKLGELTNLEHGAQLELIDTPDTEPPAEVIVDPKAPIVKMVNKFIVDAIRAEASDIHLEPTQWSLEIRYRLDGHLQHVLDIPKRMQQAILTRVKLLAGMDIAERRKPQDGRLQLRLDGRAIDLRVSCVPIAHGECVVLRVLKTDLDKLQLNHLSLPPIVRRKLESAISSTGRMILVTGPTGSGKTTTLYSCLNELRKTNSNIVTVEDPVEYRVPGVNQIQVNEAAGVTFAGALRSILRQDPDIILVGEIRDAETAQIAVQAAQTGHLVLSTLHTNDAPSAVVRLIDLGIEPYLVSASVGAVLSQRLVRRICEQCCRPLDEATLKRYETDDAVKRYRISLEKLRVGGGCERCHATGYRGRVGVFSFLEMSKAVSQAVYNQASVEEISIIARSEGYVDLDCEAIRMLHDGQTTFEEIRPYLSSDGTSQDTIASATPRFRVGVLSPSQTVRERLMDVLERESGFEPLVLENSVPYDSTDLYIVDESISENKLQNFLSSLQGCSVKPPVLVLQAHPSESTLAYSGQMRVVSKGSSPLAVIKEIRSLLGAAK